MKLQTKDLKGVALDWAVAKCAVHLYDGQEHCIVIVNNGEVRFFKSAPSNRTPCQSAWSCPLNYSTDWAQGGVIIEREKIEVRPFAGYWMGVKSFSSDYGPGDACVSQQGGTPLIAAMRCYVASKLGNEVEVPDELKGESL